MGECIELLQGLGGDLGDADADGFLAVVDAHLANELSPTLVLLETARERGRHRRPSDAGLPDSVLAIAPVTEIDELTAGLCSDLEDVVGRRALRRVDAEDGTALPTEDLECDDWEMAGDVAADDGASEGRDLAGEIEMLRDMGEGPSRAASPEEYGDESDSDSPRRSIDETRRREESQSMASGLRLSVAEVDSLVSRLCALDERIDALPCTRSSTDARQDARVGAAEHRAQQQAGPSARRVCPRRGGLQAADAASARAGVRGPGVEARRGR